MDHLIHTFVALRLDRGLLEGLAQLQQQLRGWAKASQQDLQTIPRRALTLPLMDLGPVPVAALEAARLALSQCAGALRAAKLQPGRLGAFPTAAQPALIHLTLEDPAGELAQLQAAVAAALSRYGFALDPRPYLPHLPLARVEAPSAALALDAPLAPSAGRAAGLDLMCRDPRAGWSQHAGWPLGQGQAGRVDRDLSPPELIARLLDERLADRAQTQQRPPGRRPRPAQPPGEHP